MVRFAQHTIALMCTSILAGVGGAPWFAVAQSTGPDLPVAVTVPLSTAAKPGTVIRYDEAIQRYEPTTQAYDAAVYGVVAERPAILLQTSSTSVPVVTRGSTLVRVSNQAGSVTQGDLLVASAGKGVAMLAHATATGVFAIAQEDLVGTQGLVLAEVGVERAQAVQAARLEAEQVAAQPPLVSESVVRTVVAVVLALGGLGYLLYSFRGILQSSVLSIGRNPRARQALLVSSVSSMVLVLVVVGVVLFVALGVLVLPV